jgi:hypothetical protein
MLLVRTTLATAASLSGLPHVRVTGFRRGFLNFGVRLTPNKNSRACQVEPQQKRGHGVQSSIDP